MRNPRPRSASLLAIPVVFASAIFSSGCFWTHHTPAAFTPPPLQAAPVAAAPERLPDPPLIASRPDLSDSSADSSIVPGLVPNGFPPAPAPPPPAPAPKRNVPSSPSKPAIAAPQPDSQPPPTPRLGQILSPEEIRDNNRKLEDSLERVRKVVAALARKNLTPDQTEILNRIKTFREQAEAERDQDLVIAVSLALRADLLAKDLQDHVP